MKIFQMQSTVDNLLPKKIGDFVLQKTSMMNLKSPGPLESFVDSEFSMRSLTLADTY